MATEEWPLPSLTQHFTAVLIFEVVKHLTFVNVRTVQKERKNPEFEQVVG